MAKLSFYLFLLLNSAYMNSTKEVNQAVIAARADVRRMHVCSQILLVSELPFVCYSSVPFVSLEQ